MKMLIFEVKLKPNQPATQYAYGTQWNAAKINPIKRRSAASIMAMIREHEERLDAIKDGKQ